MKIYLGDNESERTLYCRQLTIFYVIAVPITTVPSRERKDPIMTTRGNRTEKT